MKKLILFATILFSAISAVQVQAQSGNTGEAQLTLNLKAVQSIQVTGDVVIDYESIADYSGGKEVKNATTLTVVSAGGFAIKAEANDLIDGSYTIGANTIEVTAEGVDNAAGATYATSTLEKMTSGKTALISSTVGGVNKKYAVSYKGAGGNAFMERYNEGGRQYKTTVTYTISAL